MHDVRIGEVLQMEKSMIPMYASYLYWMLFALILATLVLTILNLIDIYKLRIAMDFMWSRTMNDTYYSHIASGK